LRRAEPLASTRAGPPGGIRGPCIVDEQCDVAASYFHPRRELTTVRVGGVEVAVASAHSAPGVHENDLPVRRSKREATKRYLDGERPLTLWPGPHDKALLEPERTREQPLLDAVDPVENQLLSLGPSR
jgi:hypothetical protein